MSETQKSSYLRGAAILATTVGVVKVISAIYKIPLYNLLGDEGTAKFNLTYLLYVLVLTISTAGIPIALSRLISSAAATNRPRLVKRYFAVALPAFGIFGAVCMAVMLLFPDNLAVLIGDPGISNNIRVLAPAVFFACIVAVYRGYAQGFENMIPTALSQVIEVFCKTGFGLLIAWWLLREGYDLGIVSAWALVGITIGLGIAIPMLIAYKRKIDRTSALWSRHDSSVLPGRAEVLGRIVKVSIPIMIGSAFMNLLTLIDTSLVLNRLQGGAGFSFETAEVLLGVYSKGLTLLNLPAAFIVPVTVSIIPAIAAALANRRAKEARGIMETSLKLTNLLAMPAALGLCVLAYPIFNVLYWGSNENGPRLLTIFGIASYFICMQLITTAILQANGHERVPVLTYPIGGVLQIVLDWFLVGNPDIGIIGSPIGTLSCYFTITVLNLIFIIVKVGRLPNFGKVFIMPALCSGVMAVAAWSVYELLYKIGSGSLGVSRLSLGVFMVGAILIALAVYLVLIIVTRTITREDMKLLPRGEKLANILKIR